MKNPDHKIVYLELEGFTYDARVAAYFLADEEVVFGYNPLRPTQNHDEVFFAASATAVGLNMPIYELKVSAREVGMSAVEAITELIAISEPVAVLQHLKELGYSPTLSPNNDPSFFEVEEDHFDAPKASQVPDFDPNDYSADELFSLLLDRDEVLFGVTVTEDDMRDAFRRGGFDDSDDNYHLFRHHLRRMIGEPAVHHHGLMRIVMREMEYDPGSKLTTFPQYEYFE